MTELLNKVLNSGVGQGSPRAAAYWAYHSARLTFFITQVRPAVKASVCDFRSILPFHKRQAVSGVVAHDIFDRLNGRASQVRNELIAYGPLLYIMACLEVPPVDPI